tara:strand:+ start:598 stop:774 length:177 start_codon:yes stop_codon:yes gene_type:complete
LTREVKGKFEGIMREVLMINHKISREGRDIYMRSIYPSPKNDWKQLGYLSNNQNFKKN